MIDMLCLFADILSGHTWCNLWYHCKLFFQIYS